MAELIPAYRQGATAAFAAAAYGLGFRSAKRLLHIAGARRTTRQVTKITPATTHPLPLMPGIHRTQRHVRMFGEDDHRRECSSS
jgi:hypothetical protein